MTLPALRLARPEETESVAALVEAAYAPWVPVIGRRPAPMDEDYAHLVAEGHVWVLEGEAGLEGLIVIEPREDHLWLDNIAVAPAAAGKGLGRFLLDALEARARELGFAEVRLLTNALMTRNIEIYARRGYVEARRGTEKGFTRVWMSKRV